MNNIDVDVDVNSISTFNNSIENIQYEIVSSENTSRTNKFIVYAFIFILIIMFSSLLFIIICMVYNYLTVVFI